MLCFGLALSGCTEENGEEDENDVVDNGEEDNGIPDNGDDDDNGLPDNGDDDDNDDDDYVGTGTETFSGTWEGIDALGQDDYEGTWEFTVDWDNEDVSGWFDGDAQGDIDGSVSAGEITAEGEAALGYVTWWGTFSPDGSSVSGSWEIEAGGITAYSGTWSGSLDS